MMKEVGDDDDEVVSLLEEEKYKSNLDYKNCFSRHLVTTKLFYFLFYGAQGSLIPYLALYYKELRLNAAETGVISGSKLYVSFLVILLWSMLVDKFKIGKLVFVMSTSALMTTMLIISMAPADVCNIRDKTVNARQYLPEKITSLNKTTLKNLNVIERSYQLDLNSETRLADVGYLNLPFKESTFSHSNLFIFLLSVTIIGTIFSCPCLSLVDSATVQLLAQNSETHEYGKQRLWGTIGNGLASFIVGASISETNLCPGEEKQINYYHCFYIHTVILFFAIIVGSRLHFNTKLETNSHNESSQIFKSLRHVLANANFAIFLFTVFFDGVAMSFIRIFLFWFLKDLGGTQFLFSVMSAVNCSVEVAMYFFSSFLIKRVGHTRMVLVALLCYAIRFLCYAVITKPWFVLFVEPLSGITTAALWSVIMSHVGVTSMNESAATLQGLIHSIHSGLGHGSGVVLGGLLLHNIGPRTTFFAMAFMSIINFVLYVLVVFLTKWRRKGDLQNHGDKVNATMQTNRF